MPDPKMIIKIAFVFCDSRKTSQRFLEAFRNKVLMEYLNSLIGV